MRIFEIATVIMLSMGIYWIVLDLFKEPPPKTCFLEYNLKDGTKVGDWSVDNCYILENFKKNNFQENLPYY